MHVAMACAMARVAGAYQSNFCFALHSALARSLRRFEMELKRSLDAWIRPSF